MQQREPHCPTLPGHLDEQQSYGLAVSAVLILWESLHEGISLVHAVPKQAEWVSAGEQLCAPAWPSLVEVAHEASMTQGQDLT